MILGFFPPSSKESFLNSEAAIFEICDPVFVPPVNETAFTRGCLTIASPASGPVPCTILSTPIGKPTFLQISLNKYAEIGVTSLCLAKTQFPVSRGGAIVQVNKQSGKIHGEIQPTTTSRFRKA